MIEKVRAFATARPRLAAWIALAVGMVIILIIAARDVGLLWNQWLFLILATIGLAGLCVWIIGWETGDEDKDDAITVPEPTGKPKPGLQTEAEQSAPVEQ
jgi:hypothetical protein